MDLPDDVRRVRTKGRDYYYFHPDRGGPNDPGKGIRIHGEPFSPAFAAELNRLRSDHARPEPGSVADIVDRYRGTRDFTSLQPSTQASYAVHLNRFADARVWGTLPAWSLTPMAVLTARDTLAETPVMANQMLSVGRTLYDWAIPLGLVIRPDRAPAPNPFTIVDPLDIPDRGHIPWPDWTVAFVTANAWPDIARAVRLGILTGQRQSDLVSFGPVHREGKGLWCRPRKLRRKRRAFLIPLSTAGMIEIDRMAETPLQFTSTRRKTPWTHHRDDLYLYSPRGRSYSSTSLRARWRRWLETDKGRELRRLWQAWAKVQIRRFDWDIEPESVDAPTLHGLRGTAVALKRKAGYEAQEIETALGMSAPTVRHYTRFMDQIAAAEAASARLEIVGGEG